MLGSEICTKGLKEVGLIWPKAGKAGESLNNHLQIHEGYYEKNAWPSKTEQKMTGLEMIKNFPPRNGHLWELKEMNFSEAV